jgi:hypothetical protein
MKKFYVLAMLAALPVAWFAQGQVSESELGDPGAPAPRAVQPEPSFPAPTVEPPPQPSTPKSVEAAPVPTPTPAPAPAPAAEPRDRSRVQSGKPVAAFWTVIPGR